MKKQLRFIFSKWQLYIMVLPALLYILLFSYKPMYGVLVAFQNFKLKLGIFGSTWVGFDNFTRLFNSYWFPVILTNTLTISVISLVIGFPVPILLALMVNEISSKKLKNLFQTVSYAPHFISTVVVCGMITMFLSTSSGLINRGIAALNMEKIAFLQNPVLFKWIYVLSGIWQGAGWGAIIYYAALSGVDTALLEAAELDGATRLQKIWYIHIPVLVPTIMVMFILQCGQLLNVGYEKVYLLQNSMNLIGSEVISTYVYKIGLEKNDFSFSTATGLFNSVINCIILLFVNGLSKKVTQSSLW